MNKNIHFTCHCGLDPQSSGTQSLYLSNGSRVKPAMTGVNSNNIHAGSLVKLFIMVVLLTSLFTASGCDDTRQTLQIVNTTSSLSSSSLEDRPAPEPVPVPTPTPEPAAQSKPDFSSLTVGSLLADDSINKDAMDDYFVASTISDEILARINNKSYRENPDILLEELRYIKLIHYNFDHQIQVGELIVNAVLADDFIDIFQELFIKEYEIQSMYLVDNYWTGDGTSTDSASIAQNNTSAFCYRAITGGSGLSNHAYGKAIDINPRQNPYFDFYNGVPSWGDSYASAYLDRSSGQKHMISHDDDCFIAFEKHGFTWGGDWTNPIDYQHFEKQ